LSEAGRQLHATPYGFTAGTYDSCFNAKQALEDSFGIIGRDAAARNEFPKHRAELDEDPLCKYQVVSILVDLKNRARRRRCLLGRYQRMGQE